MAREHEDYAALKNIAITDVSMLELKGKGYGRSWIKRGGVGAFMMLARKWDRIELEATKRGYDVIQAVELSDSDLLDDIQDLRRYLLLVEGEIYARKLEKGMTNEKVSADAVMVATSKKSPGEKESWSSSEGYGTTPPRAG